MKFMSGEKQVIMTGELFGTKWKIKMDSYIPGIAIVDLKVMASITKLEWVRDIGYLDFVRYWGYDIQGAIYQEIVRQNTGKKLPFYIAGATKESEPDIRIIHITDNYGRNEHGESPGGEGRGCRAGSVRIVRLLQKDKSFKSPYLNHGFDSRYLTWQKRSITG